MNEAPTDTVQAIETAVQRALPDAVVEVGARGGGHFTLLVTSSAFQGRSMVESHRLVYAAIAPLLAGPSAPVHAIDTLKTIAR